ncbi:MAG TPA: hypothetical protein VE777_22155 [Gaiellales bacterium]|jgi:hypothetical protein|nr:hypothetical protein [Gaiellales bacterium]
MHSYMHSLAIYQLSRERQANLIERAEKARMRRALKAEIVELGRVVQAPRQQAERRNRPAVQQEAR